MTVEFQITRLRLLRLVKDSPQFFNQSESKPKPKPNTPCTRVTGNC